MEEHSTLSALQTSLNYRFHDMELLQTAVTHTSFVKGDGKGAAHNERLEYLGDAVLELCMSEELYRRYPDWSEGAMTRARAAIVCEASLYRVAKSYGVQHHLRLGHGENNTGGRNKPSILCDAMEALIGAVYLDGGMDAARRLILGFAEPLLQQSMEQGTGKDYKTTLQEYVQKRRLGSLRYMLLQESGPAHKKQFHMQVLLNAKPIGLGVGGSKQEAGQQAAKEAIIKLKGDAAQSPPTNKEKER